MEFREPWRAFARKEEAGPFEAELQRELHPLHPLAGATARCIARRDDRDDFLFEFDQGWAIVHLTWQPESDPRFPMARLFESETEVVNQLQLDASNFKRVNGSSGA